MIHDKQKDELNLIRGNISQITPMANYHSNEAMTETLKPNLPIPYSPIASQR